MLDDRIVKAVPASSIQLVVILRGSSHLDYLWLSTISGTEMWYYRDGGWAVVKLICCSRVCRKKVIVNGKVAADAMIGDNVNRQAEGQG